MAVFSNYINIPFEEMSISMLHGMSCSTVDKEKCNVQFSWNVFGALHFLRDILACPLTPLIKKSATFKSTTPLIKKSATLNSNGNELCSSV